MTRTVNPLRRSRTCCSLLALATVMAIGATPANAQLVGSIDSSAGIDTVNSNNSNLIITGDQAVINWTATDNPSGGQIVFLPDNNSVTFSGTNDFAVLNRVTPGTAGNAIYMGGSINSLVGDFVGGTVYFYSPNGIVIGQNAFINVGSLGLTTLPIADDGQGNWISGFGGANPQVTFGQATNPNSFIRTDAAIDGSINANGSGNYVALVAPIINHGGTIRTDAGAVLVAAEAASITFSDSGLYNIQVETGSSAPQSLTVNGGKIQRNSENIGGDRHAYLVAVPKNDLTTLLITGGAEIGFDIAGSAGVEGNTVVLRSGYVSVDANSVGYFEGKHGNVTIDNAAFSSDVQTIAYGDTQVSTYTGPTSFSGNLDITNDFTAFVGATTNDLTIGGDLDIHTFYIYSIFGQPTVNLWAGAGATLSTGNVELLANTRGSNSPDEFTPGESVTGGTINITANDGGSIAINGTLHGEVTGQGGAQDYSDGVGGDGTGGTINVMALGTGSSISAGNTELFAEGIGGSSSECSSCNISGGTGHGGIVNVQLDQGAASMEFGNLYTWAQGSGGYGAGGNAGTGIGGDSFLSIGGGSTLTVNGDYLNFADGSGGGAEGLGNAGDGRGGSAGVASLTGGGQIFLKGAENYVTADAGGGSASGSGNGGNAFSGDATINISDTLIDVTNDAQTQPFGRIYAKANAYGGSAATGAGGSADATTGNISITLGAGSSLTAGRQILTLAEATGGSGASGGTATGGSGFINVNSGATLTGPVIQSSIATGGFGTAGAGGNATGGTAQLQIAGGTANIASYQATTAATGGSSGTSGGAAQGGTANIFASSGNATLGTVSINANGGGGFGLGAGNGGAGKGGTAAIYGNGGSFVVNGTTTLDANGTGGNGNVEGSGNGGLGTGGVAQIYAPGGTVTLNGSLFANATGEGGDAGDGVGGNAAGGSARVQADGGSIRITANMFLDASAVGGDGATGGNATGLVSPPANEDQFTAVMVTTGSGGSIDVDGLAVLTGEAVGGNGRNGNGGSAQGGEADVIAFFGDIDLNSLSIDTNAYGGTGGNGGNGGNAFGGPVDVAFGLGGAAIGGSITLGSATITADGEGGDGGAGTSGIAGGNGGAGGDGTGGRILFTGSAGGGTLDSGSAILTSLGRGGDGGSGGNGSTGMGGNGGGGGIGDAGSIQTGTLSAEGAPTVGGGGTFTSLSANASGFGGDGGTGGSGDSGSGAGGDGGDAFGSSANFLARGVLVTADSVTLNANATGGDGGSGSVQGNGGDATTGIIQVESKDRFGHPDQRGMLDVGTIVGSAVAAGGFGATDGTATVIGNSYFRVLNGDADIGSFNFTIDGDVYDNSFANSTVSVRDGTATVGDFTFTIAGDLALDASNGSMTANSITLAADNFVPDTFSGAQVGPGTYDAGSFNITTGLNFITNANLDSATALSLLAPGLINVRNIHSDTSVFGRAATTFTSEAIDAGTFIDIRSSGLLTLSTLTAVDYIDLRTNNGIQMADATSGETINIQTGGLLTGGNLTASDSVAAQAALGITLQNLSAGIVDPSNAPGALYRVGLASNGAINVGDIVALGDIGMGALGTATTGNMTSGGGILALVSGNMQFGSMTTNADGYIYIADNSMAALGGTFDNFDRGPVLAATPVRSNGSIAINGPVSTGLLQAAAGTTLTTQSITAPLGIYLDAGGNILTGALSSDDDIDATSDGSIQTGAIASTLGNIALTANGSVATGAITVGGQVQLTSAAANISTGNISGPGDILLDSATGISTGNLSSDAAITIVNGGSILTGDISSTGGSIFLQSDVDIVTGTVTTPFDAEFDALGNISLTGNASVGGYLFADAGGNLAMASATAGESIDIIAGGTIVGGNMTAGDSVIARAAGAVTLGNLSAGLINPSSEPLDGQIVGVGSLTSVTVANVAAANFVGLTSDGALNAGTVQSGGDVMVLADGPSTIGAITSNVEGRTYIAGFAMLDVGGGFEDFDPSLVYASANPIPTVGSFTVNGSIFTGQLDAFVGGNMGLGPVQAFAINGRVGGTASINGLWEAPNVELWSNDIAIGANGGIDAGNSGLIRLVSTNGTQAQIGDGLSGQGYQLDNGEFGRLSSGSLEILARGDASAGIDMLIGDLSITGPLAGSTIDDPNGYVAFATGDPNTQQAGGVIRIVGEVRATGFENTNSLNFATGRFELDAETGLLEITSNGTDLSGELGLYADRIHVAEASILDQLADDPQYDGYRQDLNAPASVQRPEGVLKAATIWIESDNLQDVLIQNTGTADTPAGFLAQETFINDDFEIAGPPGSIDLVVNGQLQTEGGVLTGFAVRDAAVEGADLTPFTANSSINGCLLTGGCGQTGGPLPPDFTPTPDIQQEIVLLGENEPAPPPFGNEDQIDNGEEDEEAETSPIVPPEPLFDTTELGEAEGTGNPAFNTTMRSHPGLVEEGEVDDPVSGSGNPALMEDSTPTSNEEKRP